MAKSQLFVRTEEGSTLAIDVPEDDSLPVSALLRLIEVRARHVLLCVLVGVPSRDVLRRAGRDRAGLWFRVQGADRLSC